MTPLKQTRANMEHMMNENTQLTRRDTWMARIWQMLIDLDEAISNDADPGMASETRKRVLDMATQDKLTLIGYHFGFPGIGNVAKEGDAYRFMPAAMNT